MKEKLFEFKLKEINGEQEYGHDYLVWAKDIIEAGKLAQQYAKTFYNDEHAEKNEDHYIFFSGSISVRVHSLQETKKQEWQEKRYRESVI